VIDSLIRHLGLVIKWLLVGISDSGYNGLIFFYKIAYPEAMQLKGPVASAIVKLVFVRVVNFGSF
jgi:hypothetical protein